MFATTRKSAPMILGVALVAAAAFQTAFAAEPALSHNERAAQAAIVGDASHVAFTAAATTAPSLAHNEAQARCVISDVSTAPVQRDATIGAATLTHNEISAQRSIVDAASSDGFARYAGTTSNRVASMRSPATP